MSHSDARRAGLARMVEVYGDDRGFEERLTDLPPESAPYSEDVQPIA